ncbi:MAG: AAA family ATPase, partial [Microthrixaceae bacterium]
RRCLYHWIEHPDPAREAAIIAARAPLVPEKLAEQVASIAQQFRHMGLYKPPGVAESIDWAVAMHTIGADNVEPAVARATLGSVLKYREDTERVTDTLLDEMISGVTTT